MDKVIHGNRQSFHDKELMEHLALEIFDRTGTGSQYATLPADTVITIIDTSEVFGSGDVWSYHFTLNINANLHIFGTAGDIHGSRLHEQIHKRKARLWVEGLPLFLGYLMLDDEATVASNGDVEVKFESGQKTFDNLIDGVKATEVSVGDVPIGIALNRKRVVNGPVVTEYKIVLDGLEAFTASHPEFVGADKTEFTWPSDDSSSDDSSHGGSSGGSQKFPYMQRWPKMVKSHGIVHKLVNHNIKTETIDKTNIQTPYDGTPAHAFCNINICYPFKAINKAGEEVAGRGYTLRLARGQETTDGGDNETRYNNAPNFYLLYFIDRLFKDLGIHIDENQAMKVEDLRRVFMLNYGCHYEEIENDGDYFDSLSHATPSDKLERYGQYYIPVVGTLVKDWSYASVLKPREDVAGKILMKDVKLTLVNVGGVNETIEIGSVEGKVTSFTTSQSSTIDLGHLENQNGYYSAYTAYATGENYPNVDISEIINAMKSMFGVRLLFSDDYKRVRIVLLRNIFQNTAVQEIVCDIVDDDEKTENNIRGFRMTYGKGTDDTNYYYKGFNDLFPRASKTWKDTSDKHDYSRWKLDAKYNEINHSVSAFDKTCYVTPVNGNAYGVKVDEDEDVLFPTLIEYAAFMDAEDGDCTGEAETIEEVQAGASPVIMNDVNGAYASLFNGDLKAPTPDIPAELDASKDTEHPSLGQKILTFGMMEQNQHLGFGGIYAKLKPFQGDNVIKMYIVSGNADIYLSEGIQVRLKDNYGITNTGTPFDDADPGLQFGIMRSSGGDADVMYAHDTIENENPLNYYWEVVPGSGAIDHPDTCDGNGKSWAYQGETKMVISTSDDALDALAQLFPNSHAPFHTDGFDGGYITGASITLVPDDTGTMHSFLIVTHYGSYMNDFGQDYIPKWVGHSVQEILAMDCDEQTGKNIIVEADSSNERKETLLRFSRLAQFPGTEPTTITIDHGTDAQDGRFSLKLRAEKLNPYYDPDSSDSDKQNQYLEITNPDLRKRGLCDQFYKEYSYLVRNGKTIKRPVKMEMAQLLNIDKTVRAKVGDVTGYIKQMQYTVSNETGLGTVIMELLYI